MIFQNFHEFSNDFLHISREFLGWSDHNHLAVTPRCAVGQVGVHVLLGRRPHLERHKKWGEKWWNKRLNMVKKDNFPQQKSWKLLLYTAWTHDVWSDFVEERLLAYEMSLESG